MRVLPGFFAVLAGCGTASDGVQRTAISREEFIEVNVELRDIDPASDSAAMLRSHVLETHGVTEDELRAFVEAYSRDAEALVDVWEEVLERQRAQADTTTPSEVDNPTDTVPRPRSPPGSEDRAPS